MEESLQNQEFAKAICFLYKENDQKNKCILRKDSLTVIYRSRSYLFDLSQIISIDFESRKLMFPLIFGGATSAFIIISIINNLFNFWVSLSALVVTLVIGYFGWMGTNVLTIKEKGNQNDFMLKHISINMKSFVGYCNRYIRFSRGQLPGKDLLIYHITTRKAWNEAISVGRYIHESIKKEGFIHASDLHQVTESARQYFQDQSDLLLLAIDPEKLQAPVKYELSPDRHELFPHIYGSINEEAVIDVQPLMKDASGKYLLPEIQMETNS